MSKHVSLQALVNEINPTVITLQEINLPTNVKPTLEGYYSYVHKGSKKQMGGISTLVNNSHQSIFLGENRGRI